MSETEAIVYRIMSIIEWQTLSTKERARAAIWMSNKTGEAASIEVLQQRILDFVHLTNIGIDHGIFRAVKLASLNRRFGRSAMKFELSVSDVITQLVDLDLMDIERRENGLHLATRLFVTEFEKMADLNLIWQNAV